MDILYCSTGKHIYKLEVTSTKENVFFFTITYKNGKKKKSSITTSELNSKHSYNTTCGGYIFATLDEARAHATSSIEWNNKVAKSLYEQTLKCNDKLLAQIWKK